MPYFWALERIDAAVRLSALAILVVGMPFFTSARNRFSSCSVHPFKVRFFFAAMSDLPPWLGTLADRGRRSSADRDRFAARAEPEPIPGPRARSPLLRLPRPGRDVRRAPPGRRRAAPGAARGGEAAGLHPGRGAGPLPGPGRAGAAQPVRHLLRLRRRARAGEDLPLLPPPAGDLLAGLGPPRPRPAAARARAPALPRRPLRRPAQPGIRKGPPRPGAGLQALPPHAPRGEAAGPGAHPHRRDRPHPRPAGHLPGAGGQPP